MTNYAELHCHSYFSLLDASSSPEALVAQAQMLGLRALALTDHDNLSGAIRFDTAARHTGLHPIIGAEVTLEDGCHLTLLAETQTGYTNLCQLITASRLDQLDPAQIASPGSPCHYGKRIGAVPSIRSNHQHQLVPLPRSGEVRG